MPSELLKYCGVIAQIDLSADDEARDSGAVVVDLVERASAGESASLAGKGKTSEGESIPTHLGEPLFLDVLE